jgi:hypothetical protein
LKVNQHFGGTYHKQSSASCLLHVGFLLGLFFTPEDGGDVSLQIVGLCSVDYMGFTPEDKTFHI